MSRYCPDCIEKTKAYPTGRCRYCDGSGINTQLDAISPKCPHCHGTGNCPTCNGTGRVIQLPGDVPTRLPK